MRWTVNSQVPYNSYDYFEKTLITENGFREYDVRWLIGKEINPNGFLVLGKAYGTMMRETLGEDRVVVGHDFRSYSQDLARSLIVGLMSTGVKVIDIGLALSPLTYFAQYHFKTKAALMVTASHNENGWTGVKIANGYSSTLQPDGIQAFKKLVYGGQFASGAGQYEICDDLFEHYIKANVGDYRLKNPVKVVVAAGNGTAGRFAPRVLRELGCDVVERDCDPDWTFKKHNPNPEDLSFLHDISLATKQEKARIGIGLDGDGDRIGVVDEQGNEIFSDRLGLLLARWICPQQPNRSVVVDVKSTGLFLDDPILKKSGTEVIMWKSGHSYIKAKVSETNAILGIEKSGHWFCREPFGFGYDDAMVSAVRVLQMLDQSPKQLSEMLDELPKTWQSPTMDPYCPDDIKYDVVNEVTEAYRAAQERGELFGGKKITKIITVNGVRFVLEDGSWGLVRASSNKPSLVVVAESRTSEDHLYELVENIEARLAETGRVGEPTQKMPARSGAKA